MVHEMSPALFLRISLPNLFLKASRFVLTVGCCLLFPASTVNAAVFASFERENEITGWSPEGGAEAVVSADFAAWGDHCLRVGFPLGARAKVVTDRVPRDWHLQQALNFFCYAPQTSVIVLTVVDADGASSEKTVELALGCNHVQLPLAEFSGVDLRRMGSLSIANARAKEQAILYLDNFALEDFNNVLARRGKMDIDYSRGLVTPHVPWGRPLGGGPIRCLLVPDVVNGRAVIELAQRLDLDYRTVTVGGSFATDIWGFGDFYGKRDSNMRLAYTYLADALINGPAYDVIVIPGTRPWGEYPPVVRQALEKRVSEGCGLVLICPYFDKKFDNSDLKRISPLVDVQKVVRVNSNNFLVADTSVNNRGPWTKLKPHYITRNVPFETFPFEQMHYAKAKATGEVLVGTGPNASDPVLAVRSYGKGRVAAFAYGERGMIPRMSNIWQVKTEYPYWEYMYSLLARSMVWAAGRESQAAIEKIGFSPAGEAEITVSAPSSAGACQLEVVFRDEFGATVDSTSLAVPSTGRAALKAGLPANAPHGVVLVDTRLIQGGRVLDWGSCPGYLEPEIKIDSIVFDAHSFRPGEKVGGKVYLSRMKSASAVCSLELRDNQKRLLDRLSAELGQEKTMSVPFSLDPDGALGHLVWVDCSIRTGDHRADRKRKEVFFQQGASWEDYDVVMYLFGPDPMPGLWPTIERELKEMHTSTLSSYPVDLCKYANFNVQAQTRIEGQESPDGKFGDYFKKMKRDYVATGNKHLLIREFCLHDPQYLDLEAKELKELVTPWVPFSPMSYYIYEEPSLTSYEEALDLCFSKYCLAAMRKWLQETYGSLEGLNAEWGTDFKSWDKVEPDDSREAQARGNYASWADHRTFMEITYAGNYAYVADQLRKLDPTGISLLSGTQSVVPHNGCDYWRLDPILGHLNPYGGDNQMDFHRTFGKGLKLSSGSGYGVSGKNVLYRCYSNLFDGCWAGSYVFWQYSVLDPDLSWCQSGLDIKSGFDEVVGRGIARLFKNLPRGHDNIAIHYSMASTHGTWITDGKIIERITYNPNSRAFSRFVDNRAGWTLLLKDLGYQYDFLAYEEIEKGALKSGGYRVMVLPMSVALSDAEVAAIKSFVADGGVLLCDRFTGVMDQHCKWLEQGSLDEVLGFSRPGKTLPGDFTTSGADKKVKLGEGATARQTVDGAPTGIIHEFGKGKAFTLGYLLDNYATDTREGRADEHRKLVGEILQQSGVQPSVSLSTTGGAPAAGVATATFDNGECILVGLVRSNQGRAKDLLPLKVRLPASGYVYNIRTGRYLGRSNLVTDTLVAGEPALYGVLPRRLSIPQLQSAKKAVGLGEEFAYKVSIPGSPRMHDVAVVEVLAPSGGRHPLYSSRIDLADGRGGGSFKIALDDPTGQWRVRVQEVISGLTSEMTFTVQP